ncbi:ABC transporter substrate-binding protein [Chloroflexi bacterium TSY]|nr:ABC transporter substrate-binding protein [Chloroflexi bacterium TSY]
MTGLLVLLLTLTSCQSFAIPADSSVTNESSTAEVDADTDTQTTLRVGYLPFISYAPLYIAAEKGYYAEQGLEVELQRFRSGSLMIAPLSTGQLDVGAGQAGAVLFNAAEQALDVKIAVAGPSERKGSTVMPFLIHRALVDNGTVTSLSDLAGRRVAINVEGGVDEYMTARILAQVGLSLDDVQMTRLIYESR